MAQVDSENTTALPAVPTRRSFLSQAAGVAAGSAVLIGATVAAPAVAMAARPAFASPPDDSALLRLEEEIFEQHALASADDDETFRLAEIWQAKSQELWERSISGYCSLSAQERWGLVRAMPESIEHDRLCRLQEAHFAKMDALVKQMWAIPALTPEGRRAKVLVALRLLPDAWREHNDEADYPIEMARNLLCEFIGGEPGAQMRDQFV